tara:strand:- start:426 stop:1826 length:1401 start_codon:yes stop_codon:yes gene_type:complete
MADLTATNLSVKNAEAFVSDVKSEKRPLSFFLGGSSAPAQSNLNTETERRNISKEASFFKRVDPVGVNVVSRYIPWSKNIFNDWNSEKAPTGNYYVINDNKVYLIIQNDEFNRVEFDNRIPTSIAPTHTNGFSILGDGYGYLYLYTLSATDKSTVNNKDWIPVPDKTLTYLTGQLASQKINLSEITETNKVISYKDPIIPILSDSGTGARIKLCTTVISSPNTTVGNRQYKIIGLKVVDRGSGYLDFNLLESLKSYLTKQSNSQLEDISDAITLGFINKGGLVLREVLQSKYVLINCKVTSQEISRVSNQTSFFKFGVVENLLNDDGNATFTQTSKEPVKNNITITISQHGLGTVPNANQFGLSSDVNFQNKISYSSAKTVSSKVNKDASDKVDVELQAFNKNNFKVGDRITNPSTGAIHAISAVTIPDVKEQSGRSLHIGETRFSFDSTQEINAKTFIGQIIQRF